MHFLCQNGDQTFLETNEVSSDKKATTNKEPISPGVEINSEKDVCVKYQ